MDLTYNLDEALDLAGAYFKVDIPFALEGPHGIGKSLGLKDLAQKLDVGFVDLRLTLCDETDLIGAPYRPEKSSNTEYSKPIWLQLIEQTGKDKGLLVVEEINRVDRLVRQPALQLLWDRKCLHWNVPTGWLPVSTWNPDDGGYEVFEMDDALLSRFIILPIKVNPFVWLKWARQSPEMPKEICDFIQTFPDCLTAEKLTPRHWHMAGKIFKVFPEKWNLLEPLLGSLTYNLKDWVKSRLSLPSVEDIWCNWEKFQAKCDSLRDRLDLLHLLENAVIDYSIDFSNSHSISESFLSGLQKFLSQLSPDAVLAWFQRLKQQDETAARKIANRLAKNFRSESISLMSHLFGDKI